MFAISISEVRAGEVKFKNRTIATTMAIMAFVPHLTDGNIEIETGDESVLVSQMSEKGKLTPREKQVAAPTKVGAFANRSIATALAVYGPIIGFSVSVTKTHKGRHRRGGGRAGGK